MGLQEHSRIQPHIMARKKNNEENALWGGGGGSVMYHRIRKNTLMKIILCKGEGILTIIKKQYIHILEQYDGSYKKITLSYTLYFHSYIVIRLKIIVILFIK